MREANQPAVSQQPPHSGWRLIVRRQFSTGTEQFPAGSEISASALGRNFRALLNGHFVEWQPPGAAPAVKPHKLAAAAPAAAQKGNPVAEIVTVGDDAVTNWRASVAALAEKIDGDIAKARDILLMSGRGSELYQRAAKIHAGRGQSLQGL